MLTGYGLRQCCLPRSKEPHARGESRDVSKGHCSPVSILLIRNGRRQATGVVAFWLDCTKQMIHVCGTTTDVNQSRLMFSEEEIFSRIVLVFVVGREGWWMSSGRIESSKASKVGGLAIVDGGLVDWWIMVEGKMKRGKGDCHCHCYWHWSCSVASVFTLSGVLPRFARMTYGPDTLLLLLILIRRYRYRYVPPYSRTPYSIGAL